jgi:protein-tyrosine-phosphatase
MGGLLRILVNRERQDTWVWDDTAPARLEFQQLLATVKHKLQGADARTQHQLPALTKDRRPRLLFLCQGNICRSSYAEKKARQLIADAKLDVDIDSAGMLPRNPRPAPLVAQEAARQMGVDLSTHASKHAFDPLLRHSDWIVIFDDINRQAVLERYPDLENRLVYLGDFESAADRQIPDPDGKDLVTFLQTYRRIDACLPPLLRQALQAAPASESAC